MRRWFVIFCGCLWLWGREAKADSSPDLRRTIEAGVHQSLSGQFIVHAPPRTGEVPIPLQATGNYVRLDASLVGVSCERIKKALLAELNLPDQWQGKVYVELHQARDLDETVFIHSVLLDRNWEYRLEMPDAIERSRFVAAIVNVLLLDAANRHSRRGTEIPVWLAQGLTAQLMAASQMDLIVDAPHKMENGLFLSRLLKDNRRANPLVIAHEYLRLYSPLSVAELSWPKPGQLTGEPGMVYRSSAQVFVNKLLELPDGHPAMRAMLEELPEHLNWQFAFFHAFKADFSGPLALDKWWALQLTDFIGRDLSQMWTLTESWQKLDEVVRPTVEVRTAEGAAPFRTQVTFETVINEWTKERQTHLFEEKLQQLLILHFRVAPELTGLVDDYRQALGYYLRHRDGLPFNPLNRNLYAPPSESASDETLRTLRQLDLRREQLRPHADSTPAITANTLN